MGPRYAPEEVHFLYSSSSAAFSGYWYQKYTQTRQMAARLLLQSQGIDYVSHLILFSYLISDPPPTPDFYWPQIRQTRLLDIV